MSSVVNILIHDYPGHPFTFNLAKQLSENGYYITYVFTSASDTPKAKFASDFSNLNIINVPIFKVDKKNFIQRGLHEYLYGRKLVSTIRKKTFDLIISANTPLQAQKQLLHWAKKNNIPFIFWLQDILSHAALSILPQRLGYAGKIIGKYFEILERNLLKQSTRIIGVTDDFIPVLKTWGIPEKKITTIYNWAPIEELPVRNKQNSFSEKYNLTKKFVVLYSGTLGMKHNPALVYKTAELMESYSDIVFVVVTEGIGAHYLNSRLNEKHLKNLLVLPFQPFEMLPDVLGAADVLLTILEKDASNYCVPSKVWSNFCAQRPSVLVVPKNNLAARIVEEINGGIILENDSPEILAESILKLKNNSTEAQKMAKNARRFSEENFRIEDIAKKFESVFQSVLQS